jgi:hypothetical protein
MMQTGTPSKEEARKMLKEDAKSIDPSPKQEKLTKKRAKQLAEAKAKAEQREAEQNKFRVTRYHSSESDNLARWSPEGNQPSNTVEQISITFSHSIVGVGQGLETLVIGCSSRNHIR